MEDWARGVRTWVLTRPVSPGAWRTALVCVVLVTAVDGARGDVPSVLVGIVLAALCGRRLRALRGPDVGPPPGRARPAGR